MIDSTDCNLYVHVFANRCQSKYFHVVFDTFIFFSYLDIKQKDFIVHCKISYYGLWNSFHSNLSVIWTLLLVLFHFKQFYFTFICDRNSRYYLRLEIPHNQRMFDESAILFIFVHCLFWRGTIAARTTMMMLGGYENQKGHIFPCHMTMQTLSDFCNFNSKLKSKQNLDTYFLF